MDVLHPDTLLTMSCEMLCNKISKQILFKPNIDYESRQTVTVVTIFFLSAPHTRFRFLYVYKLFMLFIVSLWNSYYE